MENEIIEITNVSADTDVYRQENQAIIDSQISTAKAFPRNVLRSVNNALAIATLDKDTAATCTYSVPRGGKAITGPSVHLAKIIAQSWGNMRIEAKVIGADENHVTCQAVAFDLENNLAIKVEVKRSIRTKSGRMTEDMIVVTGNAGNSIALRNAIFSVVPKGVVDKVYNASKATITGDISDETKLIKKRKQIIDGLKGTYSVTEAEILSAIGKASVDHITADEIVVLIGIGTAIKDGDTTVESAFRSGKVKSANVEAVSVEKERERIKTWITKSTTLEQLKEVSASINIEDEELMLLFDDKKRELTKK